MGILERLVKNNEPPVLFIGTGISIRYLKDFPSWEKLLLRLWSKCGFDENSFYREAVNIKTNIQKETADLKEADFIVNIKMASLIQEKFNKLFRDGVIEIDGFTLKDSYRSNIDPFKTEISSYFNNVEYIPGSESEIDSFKKLLLKARSIITTNYDLLIETLMDDEFNVFYRQSDLFLSQIEYGEIYKVHGCATQPNEIVITEEDYDNFNLNSVLISSKLISFLMESPVVFIGYSLTDQNIASILKSFTRSLRADQRPLLKDRIIYVNYKPGQHELDEYQFDSPELGSQLTVIETDNYEEIYAQLEKINQGIPVSQVRQFKERIRELIIDRGRKGSLKSLLLSVNDPDVDPSNDKLVIAIGDNTVIFNIPDRFDYLKDYMKEKPDIGLSVGMKFIASQSRTTRIPIFKFTNDVDFDCCGLRPDEIDRISQRIRALETLDSTLRSIHVLHRIEISNLEEILDRKDHTYKEIDLIAYNINRLPRSDVERYIINLLDKITYGQFKKYGTQISRLILIWDFTYNKK